MVETQLSRVLMSGDWKWFEKHPASGQSALYSGIPGDTLCIQCPREAAAIWFFRHDWSGVVEINCSGNLQRLELSSEDSDFNFFHWLPERGGDTTEILLRVLDVDGRRRDQLQVCLLGMLFVKMPKRRTPSMTISDTCRVIDGEWGHFLTLNNDIGLPKYILQEGVWSAGDIEVFRQHIRLGCVVIDVGANFGHHSVVYSKLVGTDGRVLAIEPQRRMYQLLCANCVINDCANIIPLNIAAAEESRQMRLGPISYDDRTLFGSLGLQLNPGGDRIGELVEARRLDDVIEQHLGDAAVDFVKIDIQTWEKFAIQGLSRTIANHHPAIFVEIAPYWMLKLAGYDYREIYDILIRAGYQLEHFRELSLDDRGVPVVIADPNVEWDVLALHPLSKMRI
jgi:FkbM family methyltransferase